MQELRQVQSRSQTLNGNNNAVSGNNAGTVDESGFSYRDLLQQFQDQSQNSAREREQDTPTPSKQPTPIKEISAEAMLNNLSFMSGSYNASSRAVLGSGAGKNAESQKVLMGDFNDDGILDTDDVMAIQDHIVEKKKITDPNMLKRMDLNSDGEIDVFDLTKLTNTIIGREDKKFLEKNGPMKGDLNNDGVIDSTDSDLMVDIVMKDRLKQGAYSKAADFDDDGKISVADLSTFNQTLSKIKAANSTGIKGDINNDGEVTVSDINLLDNFFRGKIRSAHIYNEDVNGDGELNKDDLESVRNFIMHEKLQKLSGVQGDINNDGKVSLIDVARLQDYVDGNIDRTEIYNEDVNGDNVIDKADVDAVERLFLFKGKFQENNGVLGDINNNGKVDANDLDRLNQHLEGKINYANVNNEDVNGDGKVDRNDARNLSNLIQYGKMETPTGINGDINNDGKVDSTDIDKLNDLLAGRENHVNVYNANVNGDNAVDQNDVAALENLINYGTINKPEPAPPPPPPAPEPYRQWQSVATARVDVYTDSGLTNHLGNEKVFAGDPLDVLDETDNAYLVRYGVGTYPNYSSYKERWIEKWAIDGANKPAPISNETPAYQPWQAVITNRVPAYQDSGLSIRHGNEEVWVGDPVDVLNETDNAYFVRYGVGTYPNYTDYKERWISKNAILSANQVNTNPTPSYQPWQTTVKNRMPAYHDANLTDRRNNEEVWVGDNVTILDETDRAYKMRYWSNVANAYKERWVDKAALNESDPVNNADKSGWTAYAHYKKQVFTNPELTKTSGYEYVDAKEKVTILEERDNAYKISYWSTAINGYKERWIDKAALTDPIPPTSSDSSGIRQKLGQLHSRNGFRDGDIYKGQGQCRGFANQVYAELFGLSGISGYSDYNYAAGSYPGSHVVGQLRNFGSNDTGAVQQLFSNVQPGAMVQMGRRGRLNSTGTAAAPHTAIVYGVNSNGVEFYEANVSGKNQINVKFYSWADLAKKNEGFTVYMPDNYPTQSTSPSTTTGSQDSRIVPKLNWPPANPFIKVVDQRTNRAYVDTSDPLNSLEYISNGYDVVSKVSELLGVDLSGFKAVSNAMDINDLLKSGYGCMVATIDGNTGESVYCFVDLAAKVCGLMYPAVGIAWAAGKTAIETYNYDHSKKTFTTPYGQLLDMTGLDSKIYERATFINNLLPIFETILGKNYAQKLVWMGESVIDNGVRTAFSSLFGIMNQTSSGGSELELPRNPFIGDIPSR